MDVDTISKIALAQGKHWEDMDQNEGWVHNMINERLYKQDFGIS